LAKQDADVQLNLRNKTGRQNILNGGLASVSENEFPLELSRARDVAHMGDRIGAYSVWWQKLSKQTTWNT
jgi:hypothetical protein